MSLTTAYVASALLSRRAGVLHVGPRLGARREIHHAFNVGFKQQSGRNLALQLHALRSPAPTRHFSLWRGKTSSPPSDSAISPTPNETIDKSAEEVVSPATEEPVTTVSASELPASEPLLNDTVVDTALSSVPAAMQYGDLAALGLISWTPAGLVRWALEGLHVSTGLPWFHTIVLVSVLARILVLPLNIIAMRDNAKLAPYRAQLTTAVEKMREGRDAKDLSTMMRARDAQRVIFETAGVSPMKLALASIGNLFVQIPLSLGLFFGIKKLCEFPVEQLKYSGISWIPDLTVPDPTFLLPLATVAFISLQSKLMLPEFVATGNATAVHWMNLVRVIIVPASFVMINLPSGLIVTILTSVACYTAQVAVLRIPAVRRSFNLPKVDIPKQGIPTIMDTFRHFRGQFTGTSLPRHVPQGPASKATPRRR